MARSRLNTKFLIIAAAIFGVLMIGLIIAANVYRESADRAVGRAQEFEEQELWKQAAEQWGRAYARSGNPAYQIKGIENLNRLTTDEEAGQEYVGLIFNAYRGLVQADPGNLEAVEGLMDLHLSTGRFAFPAQATPETREVARLANLILDKRPDDNRARRLLDAAILNLSQFDNEEIDGEVITAERAQQAAAELAELLATDPGDGQSIAPYLAFRMKEIENRIAYTPSETVEDRFAAGQETFDELRALGDKMGAEESQLPADGERERFDRAKLHFVLSEVYNSLRWSELSLAKEKLSQSLSPSMGEGERRQELAKTSYRANRELVRTYYPLQLKQLELASKNLDVAEHPYAKETGEIRRSLSQMQFENGKAEEALAEARSLFDSRPWDVLSALHLVDLLVRTGGFDEAVEVVDRASAAVNEPLPPIMGVDGQIARNMQNRMPLLVAESRLAALNDSSLDEETRKKYVADASAALTEFDTTRSTQNFGRNYRQERQRGQLMLAEGKPTEAVGQLGSVIGSIPEFQTPSSDEELFRSYAAYAQANELLGQPRAAVAGYQGMIRLRPGNPLLRRAMILALNRAGDSDEAQRQAKAFVSDYPESSDALALLNSLMPESERLEQYDTMAEGTLDEKKLKLDSARLNKNYAEVIRLANLVRAEEPDNAMVALMLGVATYETDRDANQQAALAILEPFKGNRSVDQYYKLIEQGEGAADAAATASQQAYNEAVAAINDGLAAEGIELLRSSIDAAKQEGNQAVQREATVKLFETMLQADRADEAEGMIAELEAIDADGLQGKSYPIRLALVRGENDLALSQAQQLRSEYPGVVAALLAEGEALRANGRYSEAVRSFNQAANLSGRDTRPLRGLIMATEAAGDFSGETARDILDRALQLSPNDSFFLAKEREYNLREGDASAVIANIEKSAAENPDDASLQLQLAETYLNASANASAGDQSQRLQQAVDVLNAGLTKFPEDPRFLLGLVQAAFKDSATSEMRQTARTAVVNAMNPSVDPRLHENETGVRVAAEFYRLTNQFSEAESAIRSYLGTIRGNDADARKRQGGMLLILSQILMQQGQSDRAIEVLAGYEDVPVVFKRKLELLASLAVTNQNQQMLAQLRSEIDKVGDKATASNLIAAAFAEVQIGDNERADALLQRSAALAPKDAQGLFLRGIVESRKPGGNVEQAIAYFRSADQENQSNLDSLRNIAKLERGRGNTLQAERAFQQLLERRPDDVPARLSLAQMRLGQDPPDYEGARRILQAGLNGDHPAPDLLMSQARVLAVSGNGRSAIEPGRRAVEEAVYFAGDGATPFSDQVAPTTNAYLETLIVAKQYEELLRYTDGLDQAKANDTWWMQRLRGNAQAKLSRTDQAIASYRRAVELAQTQAPQSVDGLIVEWSSEADGASAMQLLQPRLPADDAAVTDDQSKVRAAVTLLLAARVSSAAKDAGLKRQAPEFARRAGAMVEGVDLPAGEEMPLRLQLGSYALQASPPDLELADASFSRALELDSANFAAANNLGYTLLLMADQGEPSASLEQLRRARELTTNAYEKAQEIARDRGEPLNYNVLDTYAWCLALEGIAENSTEQVEQAVPLLTQAAALSREASGEFAAVHYHLARAHQFLGNRSDALTAIDDGKAVIDSRKVNREVLPEDQAVLDKLTALEGQL